MTEEQKKKHQEMINQINEMNEDELENLIKADKCPYNPEFLKDEPMGMFHCPLCLETVVAGLEHPRQTQMD